MAITFAKQEPPPNIAARSTPPELAQRLVDLLPDRRSDMLIDPSAGASRAEPGCAGMVMSTVLAKIIAEPVLQ